MSFYVYIHKNPKTKEPFYVGKGSGSRSHDMWRGRNRFWRSVVNKHGAPNVEILARDLTELEAYDLEREHIARLKSFGFCRCNLSDGGKGGMLGHKKTPEQIEKTASKIRGRVKSPEERKKISEAKKKMVRSEFHMAGLLRWASQIKGKPQREDWRQARSLALKGMKVGAATPGRPKDERHKKKIGAARIGRKWATNGIVSTFLPLGGEPPEGWWLGRAEFKRTR